MPERNHIDIWSTRLQREILALETDESKSNELLPPFIKYLSHTLNIESGKAKIEFLIYVELSEDDHAAAAAASEREVVEKFEGVDGDNAAANADTVGEGTDKNISESEGAAKSDGASVNDDDKANPHVVVVLDASLYWTPDSDAPRSGQSRSGGPQCYPFVKPIAVIKSGSYLCSSGSTIQDGDEVDIDLDWTPSIHLSDAATNVSLKIRECVKRGEPLHPAKTNNDIEDGGLSGSLLREALLREAREARESLLETKKAMGATLSVASKSMTKGLFSLGESLSKFAEASANPRPVDDGVEGLDSREETEVAERVVKEVPDIGDEIDLSEEPWSHCMGMYSCKAIKRPAFVDVAFAAAEMKKLKEVSAGSIFSRFAQSAKSAMEETFLMVTDKLIIEFRASKLSISSGTVTFAIKIDLMAKLKFRREESLSLFFKPSPDDPMVYMCHDSALAVQDIQNVLKQHGVKGKHTNAATHRAVQMALNMVGLIQEKEKDLIDNPTVDNVNVIMDLYRQAAEKFELAGDPRHAEVMAHMKRFLNQQFTSTILDGTFKKSAPKVAVSATDEELSPVPQGEILEQPTYNTQLSNDDDDDDDVIMKSAEKNEAPIEDTPDPLNDSTMENMEKMMDDAMKDMSDLGMKDDDINDILESGKESDGWGDTDDTFAELDAMLSDADKELNELLSP